MATFEVTIDDADKLAGLTGAKDAHDPAMTDEEYVQHVMDKACESYARSYAPAIKTKEVELVDLKKAMDEKFNPPLVKEEEEVEEPVVGEAEAEEEIK